MSGSRALPPRWPPQCSCVVIESSFDSGERLQAPGSLWVFFARFKYLQIIRKLYFKYLSFPLHCVEWIPFCQTLGINSCKYTEIYKQSIMCKCEFITDLCVCTVDSRYLEFDGTMEKIRVNRSSTPEELRKYRKCSLFKTKRRQL